MIISKQRQRLFYLFSPFCPWLCLKLYLIALFVAALSFGCFWDLFMLGYDFCRHSCPKLIFYSSKFILFIALCQ